MVYFAVRQRSMLSPLITERIGIVSLALYVKVT